MCIGERVHHLQVRVGRIQPRVCDDGGVCCVQYTERRPPRRADEWNGVIEILLRGQVHAVGPNVADSEYGVCQHLALNVEVPLHLVRRRLHPIVVAVCAAQCSISWDDRAGGTRHVGPREWELNRRV